MGIGREKRFKFKSLAIFLSFRLLWPVTQAIPLAIMHFYLSLVVLSCNLI